MEQKDIFTFGLDYIPKFQDLFGTQENRRIKDRLGFFPTTIWKPKREVAEPLKKEINDMCQTRQTLNANRGDRRNGVNGGKPSVFNPDLAIKVLSAYAPNDAHIYDPFAGGGTRGYVATRMGFKYTGTELRSEEVKRIREEMEKWKITFDIQVGDAITHREKEKYDFVFTCPPYYDLELYSNLDDDLSNAKSYNDYKKMLKSVLENSYYSLKNGTFAVFVVGNFRDRTGELIHLNGDCVRLAKEVGFKLWDEVIWNGASNVALTRSGKFEKNRKLVRVHEYVIVLKK